MEPRTKIKLGLGHKLEAHRRDWSANTLSLLLHLLLALILTFPASLVHAVETKLTCPLICHKKKDQTSLLVSIPNSLKRESALLRSSESARHPNFSVSTCHFLPYFFSISFLEREEIQMWAKVSSSLEFFWGWSRLMQCFSTAHMGGDINLVDWKIVFLKWNRLDEKKICQKWWHVVRINIISCKFCFSDACVLVCVQVPLYWVI